MPKVHCTNAISCVGIYGSLFLPAGNRHLTTQNSRGMAKGMPRSDFYLPAARARARIHRFDFIVTFYFISREFTIRQPPHTIARARYLIGNIRLKSSEREFFVASTKLSSVIPFVYKITLQDNISGFHRGYFRAGTIASLHRYFETSFTRRRNDNNRCAVAIAGFCYIRQHDLA